MFNGFYNAFFYIDPTVQAFASGLHSSDIPVDGDFIQYPDETDNQTYENTLLNDKSIPVSYANQEVETKTVEESNASNDIRLNQSGSLAGEGQAESVVTSQGLLSETLEEPAMDRPWFCSAYAAAGYFMCDPLTNVPKWCQYNMSDIWCPDDVGFEYDAVTGGGGSSGGGGASRTWEVEKCFDKDMRQIPCVGSTNIKKCDGDYYSKVGNLPYADCNNYTQCYSEDGIAISCSYSTAPMGFYSPDYGVWIGSQVIDYRKCSDWNRSTPDPGDFYNEKCILKGVFLQGKDQPTSDSGFSFSKELKIRNPLTGAPLIAEGIENGYPLPVIPIPNPFEPVVPDSTNECATIICQCIAGVVRALDVVNQSVLKVDASVIRVVDAITGYKPTFPETPALPKPVDLTPVLDKLNAILKAIDNISVEMVKEAETNIWDFLGDAIKSLNDLVQFIIDKVIYLIVPEDTDFLRENISMLQNAMSGKFEPVAMLKTQIQSSLMSEQKNFKDIEMTLPIYGRVEFLNVEFLNYAIPKIRALISGIMIIITSVWAYRKITSDMVR